MTGVPDSAETASFSVSFVQVPYDIDAELAIARQLGLPEYDAYVLELREGTYRGLKQALSDTAGGRRHMADPVSHRGPGPCPHGCADVAVLRHWLM